MATLKLNDVTTMTESGGTVTMADGVALGTPASGTLTNATFPAGHVINIDHVQPTSGTASTSSNTYIDCPGVTITRTPVSSSSKFLILYNLHFYIDSHSDNAWKRVFWAVHRSISGGASGLVHTPMDSDSSSYGFANYWEDNGDRMMAYQPGQWLDSPSTDQEVTYKCQFKAISGYYMYNNSAYGHSCMTLMEIAS
ncbi:uncharacterized protein METZ01_LOCUS180737 [marine metagenome]|uniref:Uncharacterized protein n=1 Tax=marine metagenome TaxID=408172 RepID=A0A382CRE7_9ZZZZ